MAELIKGIRGIGLAAEGLQLSSGTLRSIREPVILHVGDSHFLVAVADGSRHVVLIDPPHAPGAVSLRALETIWKGSSILVARNEADLNRRLSDLDVQ